MSGKLLCSFLLSGLILGCVPKAYQKGHNTEKTGSDVQAHHTQDGRPHGEEKHLTEEKPESEILSWQIVPEESQLHFEIIKKPETVIKGQFKAQSGALSLTHDAHLESGHFEVDLTTLDTQNPARDASLLTSVFGLGEMPEPVAEIWKELETHLSKDYVKATLDLPPAHIGEGNELKLEAVLHLWKEISIPLSFKVALEKEDKRVVVKGLEPARFDLKEALPDGVQGKLYQAMVAVGCPHPNGVATQVSLHFDQIVLERQE